MAIRIGILGDIGSGKSYISKLFGYPVFSADEEVSKIYHSDKVFFNKIKKKFPKDFSKFPLKKKEIIFFLLKSKNNLDKITKIIHPKITKKMNSFLIKNKKKKIVILDIPLLIENKINKKDDVIVFIETNKNEVLKRLKRRKNYNFRLYKIFNNIQKSLLYKKKKSNFIIKNDFKKISVKKNIKKILKKL